jgi:hypothetical protein
VDALFVLDPEPLEAPELQDETGRTLFKFESGQICTKNGKRSIFLEPKFLPSKPEFGIYSRPSAPPLFIVSGQGRFEVRLLGGGIELA